MIAIATVSPPGEAEGVLYAARMARTELVGMEKTRQTLGERLAMANDKEDPVLTVVTNHGQPAGVLVGMDWYRESRKLRGEPTDL
jgi:prevent-host-death family protein